jgi:hypothetical protein
VQGEDVTIEHTVPLSGRFMGLRPDDRRIRLRQVWRQAPGAGVSDGSQWGTRHSGAARIALAACEAGPGAGATPAGVVLRCSTQPTGPSPPLPHRAPHATAAWVGVYLKGLRGLSSRPRSLLSRLLSAALLGPSSPVLALNMASIPPMRMRRLHGGFGPNLVRQEPIWPPHAIRISSLGADSAQSGGLFCLGAAGIEPAAGGFPAPGAAEERDAASQRPHGKRTGRGTGLKPAVPSPSWPWSLAPQALMVRSLCSAMERDESAASAVAAVTPDTRAGISR